MSAKLSRLLPTGRLLEEAILSKRTTIEQWLRSQWQSISPPFYTSLDLRNSGAKLAPVDANLFPGGFNNLGADAIPLAVQAADAVIVHYCPTAKRMLLIPESHTRNIFYLQNVASLVDIFTKAGLEVRVGTLIKEITEPYRIDLPDDQSVLLEPLQRKGNRLGLKDGFDPCLIVLNNDLSGGIPDILKGLEQPVVPPLHAGWFFRRKTHFFAAYDQVIADFSKLINVDPWLLNTFHAFCGEVDFRTRQGEDCLASQVAFLLEQIREKYREYDITDTPYVVIKANAGTYGMGVMAVKSPEEAVNLNRKERNKMAKVKEGLEVHEVVLQEGIPTVELVQESVAEPVVYLIDRFVVGGFYRVHTEKGPDENLNAPGMHFVPEAFETACVMPEPYEDPHILPNRFYAYGVVGRLAALAAAIEIKEHVPAGQS
jgi:glutamate--cysteine ligase